MDAPIKDLPSKSSDSSAVPDKFLAFRKGIIYDKAQAHETITALVDMYIGRRRASKTCYIQA